jgi:demethoxyubiquinone hydroxylase (CLK1/Coq7/Cat5 family)
VTSNRWLATLRSAQSAARKALAETRDDEDRHAAKAFAATHGAKYHKAAARGGRG